MLRNRRGRLPGVTVAELVHYPRQPDGFQGWIGYTALVEPEWDEPPSPDELRDWAKRQHVFAAAVPELSDASGYGREPKPLTDAEREEIQAENAARREEARRERQREAEVQREKKRTRRVDDAITASIKAAQARMGPTQPPAGGPRPAAPPAPEREYAPALDRFVIKKLVTPFTEVTVDGKTYTVTDGSGVISDDGTLYVTKHGWQNLQRRRRYG